MSLTPSPVLALKCLLRSYATSAHYLSSNGRYISLTQSFIITVAPTGVIIDINKQ